MDANVKVGDKVIKDNPHQMSNNGKIMMDIMDRQNLVIANALVSCKGMITREKVFENKTEKSLIN